MNGINTHENNNNKMQFDPSLVTGQLLIVRTEKENLTQ